jgi:hypothetical protein
MIDKLSTYLTGAEGIKLSYCIFRHILYAHMHTYRYVNIHTYTGTYICINVRKAEGATWYGTL